MKLNIYLKLSYKYLDETEHELDVGLSYQKMRIVEIITVSRKHKFEDLSFWQTENAHLNFITSFYAQPFKFWKNDVVH